MFWGIFLFVFLTCDVPEAELLSVVEELRVGDGRRNLSIFIVELVHYKICFYSNVNYRSRDPTMKSLFFKSSSQIAFLCFSPSAAGPHGPDKSTHCVRG